MLTEHFTWEEVERSETAKRKGIDNTLPEELKGNVKRVAATMELVRALLGGPVKVTSWYRCFELNAAVGSNNRSAHPKGLAVDFQPTTMTNEEAFKIIMNSDIEFDQLIHERTKTGSNWIHLGLSEGAGRREVLTAYGKNLGGSMTFTRIAMG